MATALSSSTGITVRRLSFEFEQTPKYYFNNNPLVSSLLTALSLTFPTGERFFVHSVRTVRDQIHNQQLQKDVSGFIGQEAMHSHAHEGFNQFIDSLGLATQKTIAEEEQAVAFIKQKLNAKQQLAITCALEHFTAIIAHYLLTTPEFSQQLHPSVAKLWMWHALEETEHKAVAFDVYQEVFADQKTRKLFIRMITCTFFTRISQLTLRLLWQDPIGRKQWRDHLAGLKQIKQMISALAPAYLDYYKDNFHPDQHDSREITTKWREKLLGDFIPASTVTS